MTPTTSEEKLRLGNGRARYIWLWAGVWLVYMVEPVQKAWHHPEPWRRILGVTFAVLFSILYIAGFLRLLMRTYAAAKRLGKVLGPDSLIRPRPGRRFGPDVFFFEQQRVPRPLPEDLFEGAPDLVLEVLSPSNRDVDLELKRPAYRAAGIPEIWLVDPDERQVLVDRRRRKRQRLRRLHPLRPCPRLRRFRRFHWSHS